MRRLGLLAWAVIVLALVSGCQNSGSNQNSAQIRAFNAVLDAEPLDVLIDDSSKVSALALGATSSYSEINSGTRNVKVRSSSTSAVLVERSVGFGDGSNTTLVMYGKRSTLALLALADDTGEASSGKFKVRSTGLSADAGIVDLYITASDIVSVPATLSGIGYGTVTDYVEVTAGSYPFVFTAAGTKEVLFRSSAQNYTAGTKLTLGVFPTTGGRLVNALQLTPGSGGSGAFLPNSLARLKAVNAIADSTGLNYDSDGTALLSAVPFGASSSYVATATGAHVLALEASNVPGTPIATLAQQLEPARDYSLMALGSISQPRMVMLADDNTLPASGYSKVRFVNALSGSAGVDVLVNFASQTSGLAYSAASGYAQFPAGTGYTFTFATPAGITVLATLSSVEILSGGVYTAYLYGPTSSPQPRLVRDR